MANSEHLAILNQGVFTWNRWRERYPNIRPDLTMANLRKADLRRANLTEADLRGARLNFANLSAAHLIGVNCRGTVVDAAVFDRCTVSDSTFADVDFSQANKLELVDHVFPSTVGTDTLVKTLRGSGGRFTDEQIVFFEGAGVPYQLLDNLPGMLETEPLQFYFCFISYSTRDEDFATRLNEDLGAAGVRTWKWDMDAVPGRALRENIDVAIRNCDKLILVCSRNSLTSGPVEREIERALRKEDDKKRREAELAEEARASNKEPPYFDTNVLVPIRLDDEVLGWKSPYAADVSRYYIPDFSSADPGSDKYQRELQRLIEALNPRKWPAFRTNLK